jgi:ApaG protein
VQSATLKKQRIEAMQLLSATRESLNEDVFVFEKKTDHIVVRLASVFMPRQSCVEDNVYVWFYQVKIENLSDSPCQLMSRYWQIVEGNGYTYAVEGEGVVGERPYLNPNQVYEYTSSFQLSTPSGFVSGFYLLETEDNVKFRVEIPKSSLDSPFAMMSLQ